MWTLDVVTYIYCAKPELAELWWGSALANREDTAEKTLRRCKGFKT